MAPTPRTVNPTRHHLSVFAAIAFALLIVGYLGYLLQAQYIHQMRVNQNAFVNVRHEVGRRAATVGYFFSERRNDLQYLAESRPMQMFFESRGLGTSTANGVKTGMIGARRRFTRLVNTARLQGEPIYDRIAFFDRDGNLVVQSGDRSERKPVLPQDLSNRLKPAAGPQVMSVRSKILVAMACEFKGQYQGNLVAWINPQRIYDHLIRQSDNEGGMPDCERYFGMLAGQDNFYYTAQMSSDLLNCGVGSIRNAASGHTFRFDTDCYGGRRQGMIGIRVAVAGTPFDLFSLMPEEIMQNRLQPWLTIGGLIVLLVIFLAGMLLSWRMALKTLLIRAQFEEAARQKKTIEEKNRQLQHAESELKIVNQNLEALVKVRTEKLEKTIADLKDTQLQLVQSEKMASIGQLAAGVAHEINNPVGFVKSNLGTLNDYCRDLTRLISDYRRLEELLKQKSNGQLPKEVKDFVDTLPDLCEKADLEFIMEDFQPMIDESIEGMERVAKIVADLKDFAHVDKAEVEVFDINQGIESTLNIVWNELKYKAAVIKHLKACQPVRCYPQRINQVLMNLLVNAGQAIEKKGKITISTRDMDGHVEIIISDTGCGIAPEHLNKIFDPFFTTKQVGVGTGLGLNMAYNIIAKHQGQITVASQPGEGTTFRIQLATEPDLSN